MLSKASTSVIMIGMCTVCAWGFQDSNALRCSGSCVRETVGPLCVGACNATSSLYFDYEVFSILGCCAPTCVIRPRVSWTRSSMRRTAPSTISGMMERLYAPCGRTVLVFHFMRRTLHTVRHRRASVSLSAVRRASPTAATFTCFGACTPASSATRCACLACTTVHMHTAHCVCELHGTMHPALRSCWATRKLAAKACEQF